MPDDTITSSWKRFTDEVSGLRGEPADDHFAEVASAPFLQDKDGAHRAPGSSALLRLAELRSSDWRALSDDSRELQRPTFEKRWSR